nr:Phytoene desaturase [Rachicladosporium sp. CCFEE 5018]
MAEKSRQKTAVVIGAGVGGVATAARLAKAGYKVTVLEKNDFTGGRCSLLHHEGYRFDQGPSLLLLPELFKQTFRELGTTLEAEGVELVKCEPNYNIWFQDGERVQMSSDLAVMKHEVEKWEGKDGYERYLQFLGESHRHYELAVEHVLLRNFTTLLSMLRWSFLSRILDLHPFVSIWSRASKYFWTERMRRVFTFGSMYMGMSPFDAPGTYSLLQYTELAEGIWYPIGGFHRIVRALVEVGERMGVDYRLSTGVKRILVDGPGGRARGVVLESGEVVEADVVVNNSDLVYAYSELLPESNYSAALKKREGSCSSISFYWALNSKVPELQAHNIFLAEDYRESFDSIFKKHLIPDQPSFYVNVPSRVDPTAAPEGCESVVVLVPVGHLLDNPAAASPTHLNGSANGHVNGSIKSASPSSQPGLESSQNPQDWPAMIALARNTILATIKARTGADLAPLIINEISNSPHTWRSTFNLDKGAILGLSHSFFNVLAFRPSTRARKAHWVDGKFGSGVLERCVQVILDCFRGEGRDVKGLYFVGASAHPGTGVPIVLAGAKLVAEQVLEDEGDDVPWSTGVSGKVVKNAKLDTVEKPDWNWPLAGGLVMVIVVMMLLGSL